MGENRTQTIIGRNPLLEALRAGRAIKRVFLHDQAEGTSIEEIERKSAQNEIPVERVNDNFFTNRDMVGHQGVFARAERIAYWDLDRLNRKLRQDNRTPFVVIGAEIQDPHNLGAIIRTAEAAGAQGLIIPRRRACGLTPAVGKASAGAMEHLPVVQVTNLVRSAKRLKEEGLWLFAGDASGDQIYTEAPLDGAAAVVVGNEGRGIRRLLRETCDFLVRIPMLGHMTSLNTSVAGALLMYEVARHRFQ